MTQPRHLEIVPLAITILLHIVIVVAILWFGQEIKPLPVPKHIQAVIVPSSMERPSEASSSAAKQALPIEEKPKEEQINKREEAKRQAAEVAAAAAQKAEVQKAQALAEAKQQKQELAKAQAEIEKQQAVKDAAVKQKQAETEQKYALKKAKEAEKLKAELDAKRIKELAVKEAKIADEKAKARLQEQKKAEDAKKLAAKEATEKAKASKERALKDLKLAQEKADKAAQAKAAKEQVIKDAKTAKAAKPSQEEIDRILRKANADALRRFSQSMGNDDAEIGNLKSQATANAKANSIGKYGAQIKSHIKSAWRVPAGSSGITATARFTLSADGSVASVVITQSSGNDDFDASIKALRSLSGVPVPDDSEIFSQVRSTSITFKAP